MKRPLNVHAWLSLLTALPVAAGCGPGAEESEGVDSTEEAITPRYGVDYSWARPSPSTLKADGYTFVARYLSYDTTGKNLSHSEAHALINAGLDIVSNWEWGANDALDGYNRGVEHAKAAASQAAADGAPSTRPIYFSVDFDATPGEQPAINAYFDGVASVIGRARTGAYGGYYLIKRLFDDRKIKWGWQTYAWSYGQWDPRAQMRQIQNGIWGGQLDKDEAVAADFGQWGHNDTSPPSSSPLATSSVVRNNDGRLEVFALGTNGEVFHTWQQKAGGWSDWSPLGGVLTTDPVVSIHGDGRLEVFGVGTDGAMYHNGQASAGGAWSGWHSLGGGFNRAPAVITNAEGRLEVFARGTNDALYHAWQEATGGWSAWGNLGGDITSRADVARNKDGRLEVFALGMNGEVLHAWQQKAGGWSAWSSLGGALTTYPVVSIHADGRLEVFGVGTDGAMYHNGQTSTGGGWSGWHSLGGAFKKPPAVIANGNGHLAVFARGTNDALYHAAEETAGGWSAWANLGGDIASSPDVVIKDNGGLEVFARGPNKAMYHIWQTTAGGAWSSWGPLGGSIQ